MKTILPPTLKAPCCPGKSCGNTQLYLDGTLQDGELLYVYKRKSNDDFYSEPLPEPEMREWIKNMPPLNKE